jgi:sulfatase modifying factor 1
MNWQGISPVRFLACVGLAFAAVSCAHSSSSSKAPPAKPAAIWVNGLKMKFIRIPAGEFAAGSPVSEKERSPNETQHLVRITRPFWLGATHVTVRQFATFVNESGYRTLAETQGWAYGSWNEREKKWNQLAGGSWNNPGFPQGVDHPVVCVNWRDATAFCDWLSAKEGGTYRLPTEAEWEYACRAGKSTAYPWGNNADGGKGWANCSDQTASGLFTLFPAFNWSDEYTYTSPVAAFRPNAWGLYDMIGNALQWCGDWFAEYPSGPVENPQGPPEGKERVLRGGSFIYGPRHCRCAFRGRNSPDFQNFYVGFRVLMENEPEGKAAP